MTDKSFTAEEVRANIAANRRHMTTETELQLTAYADTLSKPADSGRVVEDAICPNCERTTDIRHCRACGCDFRAALAAQGQGEQSGWIVVKEHVWAHDDGGRPTLAYLWPSEFGRKVYPTFAQASEFMHKEPGLPLGWVAMEIKCPAQPASPAGVPDECNAAVEAIQFALHGEEGLAFLRCWNEGNFDACREEWPEAPASCYLGVDPLLAAAPSAPEGDGREE